jgi:glycosyltransferase involved in cell wall biosynthesis
MKKSDLVSIIMPTHNRSVFLLEAVNSVLSQSYSNWELIIIADACTDNTNKVIEPYLQDDRISFIETEQNLGGAGARNLGLDKAKGEYISFLDDDDVWNPIKTEIQLDFLQKRPDTDLVYCNLNQWFENGVKKERIMNPSVSLEQLLILNLIGSFSFVMVKSSVVDKMRINPNLSASQDWDLWVKILSNFNSLAQNCNVNLVDYRIQGQKQISTNNESLSKGYELFFNNHKKHMSELLKSFHNTVINIKKEQKTFKCIRLGLCFVLKNLTNLYLNRIIFSLIYSKVIK